MHIGQHIVHRICLAKQLQLKDKDNCPLIQMDGCVSGLECRPTSQNNVDLLSHSALTRKISLMKSNHQGWDGKTVKGSRQVTAKVLRHWRWGSGGGVLKQLQPNIWHQMLDCRRNVEAVGQREGNYGKNYERCSFAYLQEVRKTVTRSGIFLLVWKQTSSLWEHTFLYESLSYLWCHY